MSWRGLTVSDTGQHAQNTCLLKSDQLIGREIVHLAYA